MPTWSKIKLLISDFDDDSSCFSLVNPRWIISGLKTSFSPSPCFSLTQVTKHCTYNLQLSFKTLHTLRWYNPALKSRYGIAQLGEYLSRILSRIAQTTVALTRLKPVWIDKIISLSSKIRLMRSLVTSIFLFACESWTLTAELQRRIQAMEMRCYCKILHISYKDHVTNDEVRAKIQQAIGPHEDLTIAETQTAVVWSCFPSIRFGQNHFARHSERGKKTR